MDRIEFMDNLQRTLAGKLNSSSVNENIRYYQDYIDTQIRMGMNEQSVMDQLGDPRLLAKSIIEASKHSGLDAEHEVNEVYEDGEAFREETRETKAFRMPGWLLLVIVVLIIVLIFGMITSLLSFLLPFLIPVILVVCLYRLIQRRR